jgi:serine/threonine protein kinase
MGINGIIHFLAPEILDQKEYSISADMYSLGVITYQLLMNKLPFDL